MTSNFLLGRINATHQLRYRFLPYIYSLAHAVYAHGGTLQRGLAFDFPHDPIARRVADAFLFGPSILVAPVLTYGATSREVYLPGGGRGGAAWLDFYSGRAVESGRTVGAAVTLEHVPTYVRAGSIVPLGPSLQWALQRGPSADPVELRIYRGADCTTMLYEDDGVTTAYAGGGSATIPLAWEEATTTLTIGQRTGGFEGMVLRRTFLVVLVAPGHGVGPESTATPNATIAYNGSTVRVEI